MNKLLANGFYRLNTIIALLGNDEFSYSVQELSDLLNIDRNTLRNDLITIMRDDDNSFTVCARDEEWEDRFTYSPEFEKNFRAGRFDDVQIFIESPFKSDIHVVLSDREWSALADFLRAREYDLMDRRSNVLIKNTVGAVPERDLMLRDQISGMIEAGKMLKLEYVNKAGEYGVFDVRPLAIIQNVSDDMIYLAADGYTGAEVFTAFYRFDRIRSVKETKSVIPDADHDELFEKLPLMWGTELSEPVHVRLKIFDEVGVYERIKRNLGVRAEQHLVAEEDHYIYEDDVIGIHKFASWVRSYGASVVVLEPRSLADAITDSARERLKYYEEETQ